MAPNATPRRWRRIPANYRTRLQSAAASYRAGIPFNLDAWDGYPPARERLYASFRAAGSRPIVLSGDSHAFWANDLMDDDGQLVAAEFGTTAITSPSYGDLLPKLGLGKLLSDANEEVAFCDQNRKGFVKLTLTPRARLAWNSLPCRRSSASRIRPAPSPRSKSPRTSCDNDCVSSDAVFG